MSQDSVVEKALALGTTYFRGEDYVKAKDIFYKAIMLVRSYGQDELVVLREKYGIVAGPVSGNDSGRVYHPRYVKLLDNLSACWEKLGELPRALKCADKMMVTEPFNLKGYVRRGKVLQKLGRDKDAYKTYKIGLRRAQEANEKHGVQLCPTLVSILKQQKGAITARLKQKDVSPSVSMSSKRNSNSQRILIEPPRADMGNQVKRSKSSKELNIDFVSLVPVELLARIFHDFSANEIMRVTVVCKKWHQKLIEQPRIFQKFDLRNKTYKEVRCVSQFMTEKLLKPAGGHRPSIKAVRFSSKSNSEEARSLEQLLQTLQKFNCDRLILTVPNTTTRQLQKRLKHFPDFCTSISDFSFVASLRSDKPFESEIIATMNQLKNFEVVLSNAVVPINSASNRNEIFEARELQYNYADTCQNLQSIKLICEQAKVNSFPFLAFISGLSSKTVTKICICGVTLSTANRQFDWLTNFPNLEELWLENNKFAKLSTFLEFLRDCPLSQALRRLTFREDAISSKVDIEEPSSSFFYSQNLKNIQQLDLMGCSITGRSLFRLMSYIQEDKLQVLNIGNCPFIKLHRSAHATDTSVLQLPHLLLIFTEMEQLLLPQFGAMTDDVLRILSEEVRSLRKLNKLDISFNPGITGSSVYGFLDTFKNEYKRPLGCLIINACHSISHITVNTIRSQKMAEKVECVYESENWRRFGINSYRYQV